MPDHPHLLQRLGWTRRLMNATRQMRVATSPNTDRPQAAPAQETIPEFGRDAGLRELEGIQQRAARGGM